MAIKILIGGSPCTYWSVAKGENRETTAEGMGWELFKNYLIAKEKFKPDYFLYENNKSAAQPIKDQISSELGVELMYINSSLVSAQNRQRFYAINWKAEQPQDRGILLQDILESGKVDRDKSLCLARRYAGFTGSQSYMCRRYFGKSFGQAVFEGDIQSIKKKWMDDPYFESEELNIRPLTPIECERLQTLPDNYTQGFSETVRKEAIGNGWTAEVIKHLLSYANIPLDEEIIVLSLYMMVSQPVDMCLMTWVIKMFNITHTKSTLMRWLLPIKITPTSFNVEMLSQSVRMIGKPLNLVPNGSTSC